MLELYQREDCPFCRKVRVVLNELELDYICRISHTGSQQREIMLKLGGQPQVPFLVDQDKGIMMYESDAIIDYLQKTYGKSTQGEVDNSPKVCPIE
jgi:glutathione S-transferase